MHHATTRIRSRIAFTLVEVMLGVGVLVVASVAVVGALANLHQERAWSSDVVLARQAAVSLLNLLQGTNWDDLNDRTKPDAYYAWARHPDADGTDNDDKFLSDGPQEPLVAGSGDPAQRRRLPFTTGLRDLRVYIEYFRAQTAMDDTGLVLSDSGLPCQGGLLENEIVGNVMTTDVQRRANGGLSGMSVMPLTGIIPAITGPASVAAIRLPEDETISSQVGVRIAENDPVAIRIVLTWIDRASTRADGRQRMMLSLVSGRSR